MIRPLLTGILVLASTLVSYGQNSEVNKKMIRARYQVSEKMYSDAIGTLENVQPSESDRISLALTMGQALSGLGRFDESNEWLSKVTGDGAADAYYSLARNYMAINNYSAAIHFLGKHLADKNHYPEKRIRLDPAFSKLDDNREWVQLWQTDWYSEQEQEAAECDYMISRGQLDEAGTLIAKTITSYPNEPHALFLQARIYFIERNERQFRQALDRAWIAAVDNIALKNEILQFAVEASYFDKANDMSSELIRKDPTNPEYLIARALVRILDGKESMALKEIEAAEEAGIVPAELYYQAGRKISTTMPLQAESYLNRAIDTGIMDARFYYSRGLVRMSLDKNELALDDLAMSLDINPNQPELLMERAQLRLNIGDSEGACHDWKKALEMGNAKAADELYKYCRLP